MKKTSIIDELNRSKNNYKFKEFVVIVESFGFKLARTNGSHHIFFHPEVPYLLNIQNVNGEAKPYQIRQFTKLVERYNLHMGDKS